MVRDVLDIHNTYVANNVRTLCPEVYDYETPLQPPLVLLQCPFDFGFGLPSTHGATCDKFRVVTHVSGGEGLACKVGDTSTDIVVTHRDEETLFKVEGVTYGECCSTSFEMVR